MRPLITTLILACSIGTAAAQAPGPQAQETNVRQATAAAGKSLGTLAKLVNQDNFRALGFTSAAEASGASLGAPMLVHLVRLDELRRYDGGDPGPLLKPLQQAIFPVLAGGAVRTGITVENRGGEWKATGFGSPGLTRALARARDANAADGQVVVHVAALRTYFVAHRDGGGAWQFTPIRDDPESRLRAGATVPAAQALLALKPAALRYNGLPL